MQSHYHDRLPPDEVRTPQQAINKIRFADHEHLYIFRGKRLACRFKGEFDRITLHSTDLIDINNAVLVHNHPSGSSFSKEDVEMVIAHNARQLIVVTEHFTYSITRPPKGWPSELDEKAIQVRFEACKKIAEMMASKLVSQHQIGLTEKDPTIIHYIWVLFFHGTDIQYAKKELES